MALRLYPPGTRKGNKFWVVRGSINGRVYEVSTGTTDAADSRRFARKFEASKLAAPRDSGRITFAQAAARYLEFRNPRRDDRQRIDRLCCEIGSRRLQDLRPADLHDLANRLAGHLQPATRNREILRPAITVIHHAASAGLCEWMRAPAFREARPRTRALAPEAAAALIAAAPPGPQRRLLVWLFHQGTRISDTLRLRWEDIDLERRIVRLRISKVDRLLELPLHRATIDALLEMPERSGALFPWSSRSSLRRWLPGLAERAGVPFTAHMARHTLGTLLAAQGASTRAIMGALGHASVQSSIRYQAGDIEMVRAATAKVAFAPQGKKLGES